MYYLERTVRGTLKLVSVLNPAVWREFLSRAEYAEWKARDDAGRFPAVPRASN